MEIRLHAFDNTLCGFDLLCIEEKYKTGLCSFVLQFYSFAFFNNCRSVAFAAFQVVRLVFFPTNVLKSKPMEPLVVAGSSSSSSNTVKVHWKKKLSYKNLPSWAGSFIIGSLFAVFLILELNSLMYQDGDSRLASYKFISTCIAGVVGLILVEAMNDESAKERARKRAKIVAEKNSSVAVATMALNISLAALVVVDKQRSIVMYNTAFQAEHGSHGETDMRGILLEDALSLSSGDTVELINCFEETSPRERDILINNRMVRVAFSNEPMDLVSSDSAHYFLTVFSVVTRHNIDIAPDNMVGHGPIPR